MYACMCVFINDVLYMHAYTHTCTHTYIHSFIHSFIHSYIHTHVYMYKYIHIHAHTGSQRVFPIELVTRRIVHHRFKMLIGIFE